MAAGTGEHASYIGANLDISRQHNVYYVIIEPDTSMHDSIIAWSRDAEVESRGKFKYSAPIGLPLAMDAQPPNFSINPITVIGGKKVHSVDVLICINMVHISHISCTEALFRMAHAALRLGGFIYLYGPYKVKGKDLSKEKCNYKGYNIMWICTLYI